MQADDFWLNLRTSARLVAPDISTDSPTMDLDYLQRQIQSAALWLTPGTVDGFDPQEYSFLTSEDRDRLVRSVREFREVARQVPANQPPTPQQREMAQSAFMQIITLLRPMVFVDRETFRIQYLLEHTLAGKLPEWIESFLCETGTDSSGDPALWVWLNVTEKAVEDDRVLKEGPSVVDVVYMAVRRLRVQHWPYIRFRSLAELAAASKGHP